ncbi:MAG: L,D-transpeptidase [Deltaproteobacteria bacterium]|nr:L,D-transpeptidase [Deltaproteobacteria bacterium]
MISLLLAVEGLAYYIGREKPISSVERADLGKIIKRNRDIKKRIDMLAPDGRYIVVDTARSLLSLKKGEKVILQAVISSGNGSILRDPNGARQWVFDTPRGEFEVKGKVRGPVWIKPDWAFIEEGEDIPKNWKARIEEGVLGDYALAFGNGYFIHGTLYTRLLGRNVTHGCIRVGNKELESIYNLVKVGTKIYIF